jgi:hypothetical protein
MTTERRPVKIGCDMYRQMVQGEREGGVTDEEAELMEEAFFMGMSMLWSLISRVPEPMMHIVATDVQNEFNEFAEAMDKRYPKSAERARQAYSGMMSATQTKQ